ncbi:hypothetical protein BH24ACT9_BH24ACT9_03560 [soil metagenome]
MRIRFVETMPCHRSASAVDHAAGERGAGQLVQLDRGDRGQVGDIVGPTAGRRALDGQADRMGDVSVVYELKAVV